MTKQFSDDMTPRKMPKGRAPSETAKKQQKVGSPVPTNAEDDEHLRYGEGQREDYGEGQRYRTEEKTEAADAMGQNKEFGAGGGKHEKGVSSRTNPDGKR